MPMEAQIIPLEEGEAYSVQFFDGDGNTVSVYFHTGGHARLSNGEAVAEALNRLRLLVAGRGPAGKQPALAAHPS